MNNFIIATDSACDLSQDKLKELNIACCALTFTDTETEKVYSNYDLDVKEFYDKMREGLVAKTSAINIDGFTNFFEPYLKEGNDLLYLGFSSGLSTTVGCAKIAAEELSEKYPNNKIIVVDTLCASAGQGLLVYLASLEKEKGATIDEIASYIEGIKLNLCHWFTVDDLVYLKRGGRVSPTVALVGTVLGIKPILHVDNEGHLISFSKVRGRKSAIAALADKYGELNKENDTRQVFISHADCIDDANTLADTLKEKYGVEVEYIADIGPVIGAHSGPGTLAIFFIGNER